MADFFFFTDLDLLNAQTSDQAYGPVLSGDPTYDANKEKFRLTSMHAATVNPLAYAVCKGQILVQEDSTNPTLVNVILKPENHPNNDLPYIKYFIYRGILKNTLTDGTNVVNGGNTLTKFILNNNAVTPQKVLGIELTTTNYTNTDPIDNAFYLTKTGFELWTVYGGWSIGTFDKNNFGFEIVFERVGYNPTFDVARKNINVFEITKLTGSPSQADNFEYKTQKEVIVNYIDPCAFYGNFYNSKVWARISTDSIDTNNVPSFSKRSGDAIYRDIIEGGTVSMPQDIFYNRNSVYLDLRNDLNFSFNYFENYDDNVKLSFIDDNNEPSTLFNYYNSGWPILILTSLPTGNSTTSVRIAFPGNENISPLACTITGTRKISLSEKIKKGKSRFMALEYDISSNYSANSLFIISPNYNNTTPISQYIRVKYLDKTMDVFAAVNDFTLLSGDPLDLIFQPTELRQPISTTDSIKINVYEEEKYINLLNDFDKDYTGKVGIATDANNTILFSAVSKRNTKPRFKAQSPSFSITKSSNNSNTFFTKHVDDNARPNELNADVITVASNNIQLIKSSRKKISFLNSRNQIDLNEEFISIILSNSDYASIVTLAQTNFTGVFKPYLCIKNKIEDVDTSGKSYLSYELVLKGLKRNTSTNMIEIHEVPTGVNIFSYQFNDLKN